MRKKRRRSQISQSIAVSALLLLALFLLPLLVVVPFRPALWTWGPIWWGWSGRRCLPRLRRRP